MKWARTLRFQDRSKPAGSTLLKIACNLCAGMIVQDVDAADAV